MHRKEDKSRQKHSGEIAFLCPYPYDIAPGQRFRYEQYFNILKSEGYSIRVLPFLDLSTYLILYKKGHLMRKVIGILAGFVRRGIHLIRILSCDYVFIYREAAPVGWPVFEWFIAALLRKRVIYDFDDAIWLPATSGENRMARKLKFHQKVGMICRWSHKVSVGNDYLAAYARKFAQRVIINPTTIDTEHYHNQEKDQGIQPVVIGWTGTHSTLVYLHMVYPVLKRLEEKYDFAFEVIADKEIDFDLKKFKFKKWRKETEISDLMDFHIGIMPLTDDEWARGKCGFKALQYMSLGIPAVISPVGVNTAIVEGGKDGFLCSTEAEWYEKLALLITDPALRIQMGKAAVQKVRSSYSVASNRDNFLALFRD